MVRWWTPTEPPKPTGCWWRSAESPKVMVRSWRRARPSKPTRWWWRSAKSPKVTAPSGRPAGPPRPTGPPSMPATRPPRPTPRNPWAGDLLRFHQAPDAVECGHDQVEGRLPPSSVTGPALPTAAGTYLAHAQELSARHGPGPWPDGGHPLPDEGPPKLMSDAVNDGVRTHHSDLAEDELGAYEALRVIAEMARVPVWATLRVLHDQLAALDALEVADEISAGVRGLDRRNVRRTALWLVENGTRRNAVAIGLVLLGLSGDERDRDTLLLLGSLESLTLYAVVALRRSQPDPDTAVFELARRVDGWGRIHCVER